MRSLTVGMPNGRVLPPCAQRKKDWALRDVDPLDSLRLVRARPQVRRQLRQIEICLRREPPDRLPIHTRSALVDADLRPRPFKRLGCVHLVDQTTPSACLDAVPQRRQHALRPDRGFDPGQVRACRNGLCVRDSLHRQFQRFILVSFRLHAFHLPALPSLGPVYAARSSRVPFGPAHTSTMRALTPGGLAHARQVSLLPLLCRPSIPSPTTSWARTSPSHPRQRVRPGPCGPRLRHGIAGSPHHNAEAGSSSYGLLVRLRLLPTPHRCDAVAFGYMWRDLTWVGLSPPDKATLQTHDPG